MTALSEYQRLETTGLWRPAPEAQKREVIVSFGDATLMIADARSMVALAHWSLPAVVRLNPGHAPALYGPDTQSGETLEIEDAVMSAAIDKVHAIIASRRPHPGRLRLGLLGSGLAAVLALGIFWMPDAVYRHTASVVPVAKRQEIGRAVLSHMIRVSGAPCASPLGSRALAALNARLGRPDGSEIMVLPGGVAVSQHLPGRIVVLNRSVVEDYETPEVAAGFILAEALRASEHDPLEDLLRAEGLRATFRLLTTGDLSDEALRDYAERLATAAPAPVSEAALVERFRATGLSSKPYAYAVDISGESVRGLIERDPGPAAGGQPLLEDDEWVSLQGICLG